MGLISSAICIGGSLVTFLYTKKQSFWTLLFIGSVFIYTIGTLAYIVSDMFTGTGITHGVLYHIIHGNISGALITTTYARLVLLCIGAMLICIGVLGAAIHIKAHFPVHRHAYMYTLLCFSMGCFFHPLPKNVYTLYATQTVHASELTAAINTYLDTTKRSERVVDPSLFQTHYAENITHSADAPKNLVLIYLEGLEHTYAYPPFDALTPELSRIASTSLTFTAVSQYPEASYTIAGMVASQCGIPLIGVSHGNTGEGFLDSYLPGATCIGDILQQAGYTTMFLGGADTAFAGKDTFLRSHGYQTVYGKKELTNLYGLTTANTHGWGLYDDTVFAIARDQFDALSSGDRPFLLTLLSLDTHPPTGYVSPECIAAGLPSRDTLMEASVQCTDYLVGELVDHIMASDAYASTTIVIVSDHLAMEHTLSDTLRAQEVRTNRFHILTQETVGAIYDTQGSTIDIGSTILPFIGFNGRIGLGYSLTDEAAAPTIALVRAIYRTWNDAFLDLWHFPTVQQYIKIDTDAKKVQIDSTTYHIPAIITIDQEMHTTIGFKKYQAEDVLFTIMPKQPQDTISLIIDTCLSFARAGYGVDRASTPGQYCAAIGSGDAFITPIQPLDQETIIGYTQLYELLHPSTQL